MAKPLEFEYIIRCEDPEKAFAELLEARPSPAALETLKRAEKLYKEGLKFDASPGDRHDAR